MTFFKNSFLHKTSFVAGSGHFSLSLETITRNKQYITLIISNETQMEGTCNYYFPIIVPSLCKSW